MNVDELMMQLNRLLNQGKINPETKIMLQNNEGILHSYLRDYDVGWFVDDADMRDWGSIKTEDNKVVVLYPAKST